MNEKLELYETVPKSAEVAEFLEENRKAFARCEDRQKNHRANYSYAVDSGFVDGCRPAYSQDPEKVVLQNEARETLYAAIAALSETQRARLLAHFREGRSYREIANGEVDVHAVENSVNRALANLRQALTAAGLSARDFELPAEPVPYKNNTRRTQRRHEARAEEAREAEVPCGMRTLTPEPPAAALPLCG